MKDEIAYGNKFNKVKEVKYSKSIRMQNYKLTKLLSILNSHFTLWCIWWEQEMR